MNIPITDILKINDFTSNIKIGGGFFWVYSSLPNLDRPKTNWSGETLRLELNFSNITKSSPIEVFAAYSFLFYSSDVVLVSPESQNINLGKNFWANHFQFGVRFALLTTNVLF